MSRLVLLGCGVLSAVCWYSGTAAEAAGVVALLVEVVGVAFFRTTLLRSSEWTSRHDSSSGDGCSVWTSYVLPDDSLCRASLRKEVQQHIDQSEDALSGASALNLMELYRRERSALPGVDGRVFLVRETSPISEHSSIACVAFATVIQNYDILEASGNWLPDAAKGILKALHQLLGAHSPFRQRLVLLGFQWPFRSGVFLRVKDKPEVHAQILHNLLGRVDHSCRRTSSCYRVSPRRLWESS